MLDHRAAVAYYAGAQLSIPADNRVTPNGDGVADQITLGAQSPVAGTTTVTVPVELPTLVLAVPVELIWVAPVSEMVAPLKVNAVAL